MIKLQHWWHRARTSFWFLPALIVASGVLLALAMIEADAHLDRDSLQRWPQLFGAGADGSRGLLGVVASSMITVAGVVFSITIVALSLASSQYTSRVLRNFMGDRLNQFVLGAFVGIFAYCLVVLRTIRSGDEGAFVPSLAVLTGLILGLVGIAVLIFFIHHIALSIQASQILAAVFSETIDAVDRLFPKGVGEEDPQAEEGPPVDGRSWHAVAADQTGYIQRIDAPALLRFAGDRNSVVRMERGIGDFMIDGTPVLSVLARDPLTEEEAAKVRSVYAVDRQRTVEQDAAFGIRQIVDVALKALSPGVNDTTTAVMCVDYLTAILMRLSDSRFESRFRSEDGELRVLAKGPTFASLTAEAYDQIRQNATGNVAVLESLLWSMEVVTTRKMSVSRRRVIREHAGEVQMLVQKSVSATTDRQRLDAHLQRVIERLDGPAGD